jgi:hypothetical protein
MSIGRSAVDPAISAGVAGDRSWGAGGAFNIAHSAVSIPVCGLVSFAKEHEWARDLELASPFPSTTAKGI